MAIADVLLLVMAQQKSCTCQAVVDAVAAGGNITFSCGPDPLTIVMDQNC